MQIFFFVIYGMAILANEYYLYIMDMLILKE